MNITEVRALLVWLSSADGRHKPTSEELADTKARVWADLLHDVPAEFALGHARRYYGQTQQRDQMLTPGMLRSAWLSERDRIVAEEDRLERERLYRSQLPGMLGGNKKPEWFDDLVKECDAAKARGEDPERVAAAFRKPIAVGSPETRIKACRVDICQCTHTECTAGWLDEEEMIRGSNGMRYKTVKRCPVCREAMEMRDEVSKAGRR